MSTITAFFTVLCSSISLKVAPSPPPATKTVSGLGWVIIDSRRLQTSLTGRPVTLAVYQLQDVRPDRLYLGRRVYRDGMVDFFKPDEGTVEEVVTQSVVKIMEKAGFKVTLVKRSLSPEKEDFKDISADVALGGKIEALWIEAKTGYLTTDTDVRLRFQAVWGLPKERAWVTRMIEGSAQETDRPFYNPKRAETKINEVFQDGLSKLLKDEPLLREKLLKLE